MSGPGKLREARIAVEAGRFELAYEIISEFMASGTAPDRDMTRELEHIRALSRAARDGLALARAHVRGLFATARRLETYDRSGSRQVEMTAPSEVRRF
ncbi:MAG TPA: hypothetical protein VNQ78_11415 [Paracoccus sp. (in: a-proteobacteria)]|uniref:hypothetical protein n=1 Tax=Paracoccus sp. TaxID=267 RepID=UPI002BD70BB5|nr:hypothetical protein [Paracoccus sp. (in: a-proteobacteria)]HWL57262.1 hypothetical protein [Paracoccus sp. (in: a-proteobacteria)]